jgi:radical SAM superfamily enzyme YgiQ (UPF0313 family)
MKVLLINPAWKVENKSNIWRKVASCYPSLGLAYIASVLEQDKHKVIFLDMHAENLSPSDVSKLLNDKKYDNIDYVGITATTPLINCAYAIAKIVRKRFPKVVVVLGGVHPTVLPDEVLGNNNVDIVVREEGELTMKDIVNGLELKDMLGISYKHDGKIVHNPDRSYIENLDDLPPPAYHLIPIEKYRPAIGSYKRLPAMSIFATRGCPGRCTFCHRAFKGRIRAKSAPRIIEEIKILQREYGIREINFYDDTFTALKKNVEEFCKLLIKEKIDITWSCFTRVNYVDKKLFSLMKKSGCHQVMMGIESGVQEMLDGMNKMVTLAQIRRAVKICKEVGLETRAAYILGNISETSEMMQRTLDFAIELDTDYAQFNILTAYPGTEVWKLAEKNGWLRVKNYDYSVSDFTLELPTVSQEEITAMYKKAHRKYYLRPKIILRRIWKIRSWAQLKQELLGALAVVMHAD